MAFCNKCGTELKEDAKFCVNCGTVVPAATVMVQPEVSPLYREPPRCTQCGTALKEGAAFCAGCGAKANAVQAAAQPASPPRCTQCGAALKEGAAFCAGCGAKTETRRAAVEAAAAPAAPVTSAIPQTNTQQNYYLGRQQTVESGAAVKKNLWQHFVSAFKKYAVFKGRARRAEYWGFTLFMSIIYTAVCIPIYIRIINIFIENPYTDPAIFYWPYVPWLVFLLPSWGVMVRRFHDCDKRAWWGLIPIYNFIVLCSAGTPGPNRFGPDPKQTNQV